MRTIAWHLPWKTSEDAPHALLDILRGCNIRCDACYNRAADGVKSLRQIEKDLDVLQSLRRVQSISLVGGEVTLHPELLEIVRRVKARGLCVEIFTNGLLLEPPLLAALAEAGTDLVFLHIDRGQTRPDLPQPVSPQALRALIDRKAALVAKHGMDAGLTMTAYGCRTEDIVEAMAIVRESPHLNYLLVTLHRDVSRLGPIQGDLLSGMWAEPADETARHSSGGLTNREIADMLRTRLGLRPFACLGSNIDRSDPRWVSYLLATLHAKGELVATLNVRPSLCEQLFVAVSRRVKGRYPMYQAQNAARFRVQLLLNALMGGRPLANLAFLLRSCRCGARIRSKRILFQNPAFVDRQGRVVHCLNCPDAVVMHGRLVPVCICDCIVPPEAAT